MYPILPTERLVETKTCRHCQASFPITDKDLEFYDKISPVFSDKKYPIPTPTLCPDCRQQRRMSFRNERKLYKRKDEITGENVISIYSPQSPYKIYDNDYWWGDSWDAVEYAKDIDWDKSFFAQLDALQLRVPRLNNNLVDDDNTHYSNQCWHIKNSYLCFNVGYSEDCLYSNEVYHSKNIMDCLDMKNCELAYGSFLCNKSYDIYFSEKCENCSSVYFSYDCKSCNNIFLCSNLKNKSYCIRNKQYSKEDYGEEISKIFNGKHSIINNLLSELGDIKNKAIHNQNSNISTESSTGDYLTEVKNCENCFNIYKASDCKYVHHGDEDQKDSHDLNYIAQIELGYEGAMVAGYKNLFCLMVVHGSNNFYCNLCIECNNCFGCVGLKHKQYYILNKQYTKDAYEELVPKIIEHMDKMGEWGEFFPSSLSPFGYNETVAMEYFPLNKEEATKNGVFNWSDYEAPFPWVEKIIPASKLPDDITKIPDDILNWAIKCEVTGKPFRIIKQELEFYRKHNLPIPRRHPDQRHLDRMALRNPRKLFERKCDKCGVEMMTTYAPERPELVYCESCYNKEIY